MLSEASYYLRLSAGLARLQLSPKSADPIAAIREQMQHRGERFLQMARYALEQSESVYRRLFDFAGCSFADLEAGVKKDGLRVTLGRLAQAGVYMTHDEFRGRKELVRGSLHVPWDPRDFENPWGRGSNPQATSGSTGRRLVTYVSNEYILYREGHEAAEILNMDLRRRPRVVAGPILPSTWPLRRQITWHRLGVPVNRWFAIGAREGASPYGWITRGVILQTKLLGGSARYPEYLPMNDFTPIAECLAQYCADGTPAYVRTVVSAATRVASIAIENSIDIRGTIFSVSGEPLTPAKRDLIQQAGASVYPCYVATEFGTFGYACQHMNDGDSVHLFEDNLMLVAGPNELLVSNLLLSSPRILINVGTDDSATITEARCDCEYYRLGFTMQARNIFSHGKVTTQGTTIAAADLAAILESSLPRRFGGSPGDFQLAEIDGPAQSEIVLRVSPRIQADPRGVGDFFLAELSKVMGGSLSKRLWSFSKGIRVVIEEPEMTSTGKVHPVRLRTASAQVESLTNAR